MAQANTLIMAAVSSEFWREIGYSKHAVACRRDFTVEFRYSRSLSSRLLNVFLVRGKGAGSSLIPVCAFAWCAGPAGITPGSRSWLSLSNSVFSVLSFGSLLFHMSDTCAPRMLGNQAASGVGFRHLSAHRCFLLPLILIALLDCH